MFRLLFDLVRTAVFMTAVLVAFIFGGIVFNLDRLGNLDVTLLKYKHFLPAKVKKFLPGQDIPYTRPTPSTTLAARVLEVYDGDTLTVLSGSNKFRIRMFGIDAPEATQEYGLESRDLLRDLVLGETVSVEIMSADQYGRAVAVIRKDLLEINTEMIRSGAAWYYEPYASGETAMEQAQQEARKARMGLWQNAHPLPPWDYRKQQKNKPGN